MLDLSQNANISCTVYGIRETLVCRHNGKYNHFIHNINSLGQAQYILIKKLELYKIQLFQIEACWDFCIDQLNFFGGGYALQMLPRNIVAHV